jgi:hypothetical protein
MGNVILVSLHCNPTHSQQPPFFTYHLSHLILSSPDLRIPTQRDAEIGKKIGNKQTKISMSLTFQLIQPHSYSSAFSATS